MRVLGLSAFHRDAAAALVVDGVAVSAAQEERFTRKRLDPGFPRRSARWCLAQAGVRADELDAVVFHEKPLRKFERMLVCQLRAFPRSSRSFARGMFLWLGDRLWMQNRIADELGIEPKKVAFVEHLRAHAACAYFTAPFEEAAVLVVDDLGEWASTMLAVGRADGIEVLSEIDFPHSLGLVASSVTQFLGFEPGREEELVEALAAHGSPRFLAAFEELVPALEGGAYRVDQKTFRFAFDGERLFSEALSERLGPARAAGSPLRIAGDDRRDADVAASLQALLEERVLALAHELARRTPARNLCFGGLLASNRRLNARLLADGPFESLHVPAAPDEAGTALGAALLHHHALAGSVTRSATPFLGGLPGEAEGAAETLADEGALTNAIAERLARGEALALARGPMEFASRSLGHRSLLAGALAPGARAKLLGAVRRDENFRECRVLVPAERAADFVELRSGAESALRHGWLALPARGLLRERAPELVAPDGRVQVQTVARADDPLLADVLARYAELAGLPLVLHASLALRGAPLARTADDALDLFRRSALDALFVERALYVAG